MSTFAELVLVLAFAVVLYLALGPIRRRLEWRIVNWLNKRSGRKDGRPVIDISDHRRKPGDNTKE